MRILILAISYIFSIIPCLATPANRLGMVKYYDRSLSRRLGTCTTCHLPTISTIAPNTLKEFPHNLFGARLMRLGLELRARGAKSDIVTRLALISKEDSDGDGIDNLTELLLNHSPGDKCDLPSAEELNRPVDEES